MINLRVRTNSTKRKNSIALVSIFLVSIFMPGRPDGSRNHSYSVFDFYGHAEGIPCTKDILWLFLLQEPSNFHLYFFTTREKSFFS